MYTWLCLLSYPNTLPVYRLHTPLHTTLCIGYTNEKTQLETALRKYQLKRVKQSFVSAAYKALAMRKFSATLRWRARGCRNSQTIQHQHISSSWEYGRGTTSTHIQLGTGNSIEQHPLAPCPLPVSSSSRCPSSKVLTVSRSQSLWQPQNQCRRAASLWRAGCGHEAGVPRCQLARVAAPRCLLFSPHRKFHKSKWRDLRESNILASFSHGQQDGGRGSKILPFQQQGFNIDSRCSNCFML